MTKYLFSFLSSSDRSGNFGSQHDFFIDRIGLDVRALPEATGARIRH